MRHASLYNPFDGLVLSLERALVSTSRKGDKSYAEEKLRSLTLIKGSALDVADMMLLQEDVFSPSAARMTSQLLLFLSKEPKHLQNSSKFIFIQSILSSFDGHYRISASAPVFLEAFRVSFRDALLRPLGSGSLARLLRGESLILIHKERAHYR